MEHDNAYKNLFSHPQAVADLLRGFVQEDWVQLLDWPTLEKVSGSYVSDDLRDREDDIIWRVRMRTGTGQQPDAPHESEWLYVYLLLEFQSTVDAWMAVRILTYIGLLYQDLIKSGQTKGKAKLPPVFPLVLYNGERPWSAATEVADLIEAVPASLAAYRPRLRYFLMDQGRLPEASLDQPDNPIASLVQIERMTDPTQLQGLVAKLAIQLKAPHNAHLRRAFAVWINRMVLRRFDEAGSPLAQTDFTNAQDLPELQHMIAERINQWKQEYISQGMLEGELKGQALALRKLLIRRFGELPGELQQRISQADEAQIEQWFDRVLDADCLAAVFGLH